ncbi:MAG: hypothetical protein IH591_14235 [Bacteroidales bacterium]|nr:hypothetical protein [Bacteroidales bacterium]
MKKKYLILSIILLSASLAAQEGCKVLVPALEGKYTGDCRRGLANGEGSAVGTDSYQGGFRNGLPHGYGVYTYSDGIKYIGNFLNGKRDGHGFLSKPKEVGYELLDYGQWFADSLIVPYDVRALMHVKTKKGITLVTPELKRDEILKDQVWIHFMKRGAPDNSVIIEAVNLSSGKKLDTYERSLNTLAGFQDFTEFPVTIEIRYQIQKDNDIHMTACHAVVTLLVPGIWDLYFHH